jgi:predicted ester cyclase
VVVHWTAKGTHKGQFLGMPATNKQASVTGTSIYRLEGSKIVESWANWNLMSMMEQLGVGTAPQEQKHAQGAATKTHA